MNKFFSFFSIQIISTALIFLLPITLGKLYDPGVTGNFYKIHTNVNFSFAILSFGITNSIIYFTSKNDLTDSIFLIVKQIIYLFCIISFFSLIFIFLFKVNLDSSIIFTFCSFPLFIGISLFSSYYLAVNNYLKFNLLKIAFPLIIFTLTILNFKFNLIRYNFIYVIYFTSLFLSFLLIIKNIFSEVHLRLNKKLLNQMFYYSKYPYVADLLTFISYRGNVYIILYFFSNKELGIFSLGVSIMEVVFAITNIFCNYIFPRLAKLNNLERDLITINLIKIQAILALLMSTLLVLFSKLLIIFFLNPKFADSFKIILILSPGILFFSITKIVSTYFMSSGQTNMILKFSILSVILNMVLAIVLIYPFSFYGIAIGTSIGYFLTAIIMLNKFRNSINTSKNKNIEFSLVLNFLK